MDFTMHCHDQVRAGTPEFDGARAPRRPVVLVVDDEPINRMLIAGLLETSFDVIEAVSGPDALAKFAGAEVDIVVMDVRMPGMDGIEAAKLLKRQAPGRFLPVLLMTANNDEALLSDGMERGADDFVIKPVNRSLLKARLRALLRESAAFHALHEQNAELASHRIRSERDYLIARRVFERVAEGSRFDLPDLTVHTMALVNFSGDFVLSAFAGTKLRVLVGDFAGHGLAAAVGALPVSEAFYTMAERDLDIGVFVSELNAKLHRMFPRDVFLAACVADIDLERGRALIWNGGLPDVLLAGASGGGLHHVPSGHPPLGILPPPLMDTSLVVVPFQLGDRLAICTDGLLESRSPDGIIFGPERLEQALFASMGRGAWANELWGTHRAFLGSAEIEDDVTLFGLTHTARLALAMPDPAATRRAPGVPVTRASLHLRLDADALRAMDLLPPLRGLFAASAPLAKRAVEIQMIMTELMSNSIEHGLLSLDPRIKEEQGGFDEYYRLRAEGLQHLSAGAITLSIEVIDRGEHLVVVLTVSDTGPGFSLSTIEARQTPIWAKSGRGLRIIKELCSDLQVVHGGTTVATLILGDELSSLRSSPAAGARG